MQAKPATAHMFIVNPLAGKSVLSLFATHPPLEDRIARLRGTGPSPTSGKSNAVQDMNARARASWERLSR